MAGAAMAQAPAGAQPEQLLGEVVVTATRQSDTINRVAMSVAAVTQQSIQQQGLNSLQDLARVTPGVTFQKSGQSSGFDINIRGVYSPVGAPTVGVYLDDVSLAKRGASVNLGSFSTAIPQLFDLDRVEVLKGPQGTLYGGSAMGGAIRFITPTPSLTKMSTYISTQADIQDGGDPSYQFGAAVGGPIIEDKLGFRVSGWAQHTGGWLDHVDLFTKKSIENNTNSGNAEALRGSLLWQATPNLRIMPSIYYSNQHADDNDQWMENIPAYRVGAPTAPAAGSALCNGSTISTGCNASTLKSVNGVPLSNFNIPNGFFKPYTDGPYDFYGPFKTPQNYDLDTNGNAIAGKAPYTTRIFMPAITIDYDMGLLQFHSTTAYENDLSTSYQLGKYGSNSTYSTTGLPTNITGNCGNGAGPLDYVNGCSPVVIPGFPQVFDDFHAKNQHTNYSQEFRVSSRPDLRPVSFVAGVYYSSSTLKTDTMQRENDNELTCFVRNICGPLAYGYLTGQAELFGVETSESHVKQRDQEIALFGEANWYVTEKLKLTAGVRMSQVTFDFRNYSGGPHGTGSPAGFVATVAAPFAINYAACPNTAAGCPYLTITGHTVERPITPKFGVSYQATDRTLLYFTAAQGFRPGGVNAPVNPGICAADFAALGITSTPTQFLSDKVWSYEGGVKSNIAGRAQINASAFYVDWQKPQSSLTLAQCGRTYTGNAGAAAIKGADVQGQWRVGGGLTLSGSVAYQDARYTQTVFGLGSSANPPRLFASGEPIRLTPTWTYTLGGVYNFEAMTLPAYVRADYEFRGAYVRGVAQGDAGYDAVIRNGAPTHFMTARAGVTRGPVEVNIYAINLTNSQDIINEYHVAVQAPQVMATTFRPRQIGMQIVYKH
jgi:iron complex outermembrane receptor protein